MDDHVWQYWIDVGVAGGQPGQIGENILDRADGTSENIGGQAQFKVGPDDVLTIKTPGGGGFGVDDQ